MNNDSLILQACNTVKNLKVSSVDMDGTLGRLATCNAIFIIKNKEAEVDDPKIIDYKENLKKVNESILEMQRIFRDINATIDLMTRAVEDR